MSSASSRALAGDRPFWVVNAIVSTIAIAGLAYLLLVRQGTDGATTDLSAMPAVNAGWNALSATCLVFAVRAIRRGDVKRHRRLVLGAFAASLFFFAGYLAYHYVHGDTKYPGGGAVRIAYLLFLASHVLMSIPVVPLCIAAVYYALTHRFATHRKITRVLYPVCLYVSVTGVVVFAWLRIAQ